MSVARSLDRRAVCGGLLLGGAAASGLRAASADAAAPAAPARGLVDHHVHVHSPAILAMMPAYCGSPGRIGKCDPAFEAPLKPADLLAQMDKAGVARAHIMSTAYLAESPMMVPEAPDHARILREANGFTVGLAKSLPHRFAAFIGVNPIRETALPELAYWKGDRNVTGIKLHVTNSGVDLRSPEHLAKLASVFRAAAANGWAIMIHMRTRAEDYGARDVRAFIDQVLPAAGTAPVQIAHAAGWGGIDKVTLDALGAFADALAANPAIGRRLRFDLACVWKQDTSLADREALAALIRRIGPQAFVPASDWPFCGDLKDYYERTYPLLPLTPAEWGVIMKAP